MRARSRILVLTAAAALAAACDQGPTAPAPEVRRAPEAPSRVITGTGLTIYTDRATWEAAVVAAGGTVQPYDFTGLTTGRVTQTLTDYGSFAISVDAVNTVSPFFNPGIDLFPDASCSLGTGDCTVFTFDMIDPTYTALGGPHVNSLIMPQTIRAWGGDMVQAGYTAPAGDPTGPITVSTGSGDSFTINDYVSSTGYGFVGFITTNPTTTLTFTFAKSGTIVNEIFQVYNAAYANGAVVTTPVQKIDALRTLIGGLSLSSGIKLSLDAKLRDALTALGASNTALACSDLQDVIGQAIALSGKKLTPSDAAAIVTQAGAIRTQLGC
jgi:hypothetical protein